MHWSERCLISADHKVTKWNINVCRKWGRKTLLSLRLLHWDASYNSEWEGTWKVDFNSKSIDKWCLVDGKSVKYGCEEKRAWVLKVLEFDEGPY